jgi:hypothetical protein
MWTKFVRNCTSFAAEASPWERFSMEIACLTTKSYHNQEYRLFLMFVLSRIVVRGSHCVRVEYTKVPRQSIDATLGSSTCCTVTLAVNDQ